MTSRRTTTAAPLPAANPAQGPAERAPEGPIDCQPLGETLARAEATTSALRVNYPIWARSDLDKAQTALNAARREAQPGRKHLDELHAMMHNIKGQGTSFGYPLVTRIGQSLCRLVAPGRALDAAGMKVAQAHLEALMLVLDQRIAGSGDELGDRLARRLEGLTEKATGGE
jgi:hypothetical protein